MAEKVSGVKATLGLVSSYFDSGVQSTDFSQVFVKQEKTQLKLVL